MVDSIDVDTLSMLKDVMEDDFTLLIQTFIDDTQARIPQLRSQLTDGAIDELRRNAHSLKGSCSNIGAMPLSLLGQQVEDQVLEGKLEGIEGLLEQIEHEFASVSGTLRTYL